MYMAEAMDAGDMIDKEEIKIEREDTTKIVFEKLEKIGKVLLIKTLRKIEEEYLKGNLKVEAEKQKEEEATYAPMIKKEFAIIDFKEEFEKNYNKVRGLNDFLVARVILDNINYKIWKVKDYMYINDEIEKIKENALEKLVIEKKDSLGDVIEVIAVKEKETRRLFLGNKENYYLEILEIQKEGKNKKEVSEFLTNLNAF